MASFRVAEKILVSYEASDSEGERNDAEKSISEVQLEQSPINVSIHEIMSFKIVQLSFFPVGGSRKNEKTLEVRSG